MENQCLMVLQARALMSLKKWTVVWLHPGPWNGFLDCVIWSFLGLREIAILSPRGELRSLVLELLGKWKFCRLNFPTVLQQEVYVPQDPESPEEEEIKEKKPTSQGKSSSKKETFKRDGKEKKDRGVTRVRGLVNMLLFTT